MANEGRGNRYIAAMRDGVEEGIRTGTAIGSRVLLVVFFVVITVLITSALDLPAWTVALITGSSAAGATVSGFWRSTDRKPQPLPSGGFQEPVGYLGRISSASWPALNAARRPDPMRTETFMNVFAISAVREGVRSRADRDVYPCVWVVDGTEFRPVSEIKHFDGVERGDFELPLRRSLLSELFGADPREDVHASNLPRRDATEWDLEALGSRGFRAIYAVRIIEADRGSTVAAYGALAREPDPFNPAQRAYLSAMGSLLSLVWDASPPPDAGAISPKPNKTE